MCGRFAFYSPSEATAALFGVDNAPPVEPRYNIAPTQYIAAVRNNEKGSRELTMLRWGLVPFWAKDPSIGNRMINARAETVAEKPSFRSAYKKRRCLILADGFYEWHTEAGTKTPWFISPADGKPFAFAGLWETWQDKESDESMQTGTIITSAASAFMETLHHRMPVILQSETASVWLAGGDETLQDVAAITPKMRAWPVARTVNNARNEGAELIDPAGEELREA
ncbi:MAG: SOS response-associated peptidase [Woeseia sp.]